MSSTGGGEKKPEANPRKSVSEESDRSDGSEADELFDYPNENLPENSQSHDSRSSPLTSMAYSNSIMEDDPPFPTIANSQFDLSSSFSGTKGFIASKKLEKPTIRHFEYEVLPKRPKNAVRKDDVIVLTDDISPVNRESHYPRELEAKVDTKANSNKIFSLLPKNRYDPPSLLQPQKIFLTSSEQQTDKEQVECKESQTEAYTPECSCKKQQQRQHTDALIVIANNLSEVTTYFKQILLVLMVGAGLVATHVIRIDDNLNVVLAGSAEQQTEETTNNEENVDK